MSKSKVFYILIVTLAGVFFIYRESINVYWAQTYHQESPLAAIERWVEPHIDALELDWEFLKIDEADYKTDIVSQSGLKGVDRIVDEASYQRHLPFSDGEITSKEVLETIDLVESDGEETPYSHVDPMIAGPFLPQLPSVIEVMAGDKLFFVGDSLMQGVAPRVRQSLYRSENIDGVDLSKQSTGLAYPKFYNWPEVVAQTLEKDLDIKAVIVYMGANDPWDFPVPGRKQYLRFKSADWERAYRERVQKIILEANRYQLPVIWLGAPCMRKEKLHQDMVYLNTIYASEMAKFNGTYIPTSDLLGCSDEEYSAYVESEEGNRKVRTNDGIHFTPTGQRLIAERVIEALTIIKEEVEDEVAEPETSESDPVPAQDISNINEENIQEENLKEVEDDLTPESPLMLMSTPENS
ncbi:DUF459 domain-containing protein [Ignatzschineria rhizosphaerae]|uniref:DUF459 domain-containing protein n=1 Tax=Ignatzschineria rhizosphaerae TaxID=2923279 RepID=A0ABY3X0Z1_9GAMM|nr:DUF459 domain-containing protein [Ignatzschineria rhizosphaerae]UNM96533.1 DUF459 domain-containing protein [Ignatzschineria rhizosphaerae]